MKRKKTKTLDVEKKSELHRKALVEANMRAFYYLKNHVARSDDEYLASAADILANELQSKALKLKD